MFADGVCEKMGGLKWLRMAFEYGRRLLMGNRSQIEKETCCEPAETFTRASRLHPIKAGLHRFQTPFAVNQDACGPRRKEKKEERVDDAKRGLWAINVWIAKLMSL